MVYLVFAMTLYLLPPVRAIAICRLGASLPRVGVTSRDHVEVHQVLVHAKHVRLALLRDGSVTRVSTRSAYPSVFGSELSTVCS